MSWWKAQDMGVRVGRRVPTGIDILGNAIDDIVWADLPVYGVAPAQMEAIETQTRPDGHNYDYRIYAPDDFEVEATDVVEIDGVEYDITRGPMVWDKSPWPDFPHGQIIDVYRREG